MSSRYHRLLTYDVKVTTKIDSMGPFNMHLTKSPKRDHIYKLFLYTLEEHKCLILTS